MNEKRNIVSPSTFSGCIHKFLVGTLLKSGLLKFKEKSGCTLPNVSPYRISKAISTTLFFYFTQSQTFLYKTVFWHKF